MAKQIISNHFLQRISLNQEQLGELLNSVSSQFDLGEITSIKGIEEGYEDVNIDLRTEKGHYLCKILVNYLEKQVRTLEESQYYVHVMKEFARVGVRVPNLYKTSQGDELFEIELEGQIFRVIVMEFFDGNHFWQVSPTLEDNLAIVKILSKLHSSEIDLKEHVYDDPWQPQFLSVHFPSHKELFTKEEQIILAGIIDNVGKIDFSKYKKTPAHGDIMRNNIMKSEAGEYCLLDFGVVSKNYWIIDLAVFIAGFCLDPNVDIEINQDVYRQVVESYTKPNDPGDSFSSDLHVLVMASYAAIFLAATIEKGESENVSPENKYWIDLGRDGMQMMKQIKS